MWDLRLLGNRGDAHAKKGKNPGGEVRERHVLSRYPSQLSSSPGLDVLHVGELGTTQLLSAVNLTPCLLSCIIDLTLEKKKRKRGKKQTIRLI